MLRIEQPQTAIEIYYGIRPSLDTIEIQQPTAWVRLLVHQQRQAHRDLSELKRALGDKIDRTDLEVIEIERNYQVLCEAVQYLYSQQETDSTVSHEWIQTELMRMANVSQHFTADIWWTIVEKNAETTMADHQRGLQIARLNDALAFIQTADGQRRQEQANFNHNGEQWAATQEATTEKLAADNAAIKADLAAIRKKAEELKSRKPTYLQTARRTSRPPTIPENLRSPPGDLEVPGHRHDLQRSPWLIASHLRMATTTTPTFTPHLDPRPVKRKRGRVKRKEKTMMTTSSPPRDSLA